MIREEKDYSNMTISVYLLNGKVYENCDVPTQPFGQYERTISFYHDDRIFTYPLTQVEHIEMSF